MYSSNGGPLSQAGRWGHESRPERYGRLAILVHSKHSVYNGLWYVVKTVPGEGRKYLKALSSVSLSLAKGVAVFDVVACQTDCCASTGMV